MSLGIPQFVKGQERKAVCDCGAEYTQSLLHPAWLEALRREGIKSVDQQFPDGWTPDYCPPCARAWNRALANVEQPARELVAISHEPTPKRRQPTRVFGDDS
jgi:hypothetical protein